MLYKGKANKTGLPRKDYLFGKEDLASQNVHDAQYQEKGKEKFRRNTQLELKKFRSEAQTELFACTCAVRVAS